jgi:hypothetical protein
VGLSRAATSGVSRGPRAYQVPGISLTAARHRDSVGIMGYPTDSSSPRRDRAPRRTPTPPYATREARWLPVAGGVLGGVARPMWVARGRNGPAHFRPTPSLSSSACRAEQALPPSGAGLGRPPSSVIPARRRLQLIWA